MQPTLDELRELSRHSIRAQNAGFLAMMGTLPLFVAVAWVPAWWVAFGAATLAGGLFVNYAHRAGKARGAFRKVFKRIKDEKKMARRLALGEAAGPEEEQLTA